MRLIYRGFHTFTSLHRKMETEISSAVVIYRKLASHPEPKSAVFSNKPSGKKVVVSSAWTQSDLERSEKVNFTKNYVISQEAAGTFNVDHKFLEAEKSNELWNQESPSGKFRAVVRKHTPKKGEEKQFIEIWDENGKIKNFDVLDDEEHGKIYDNDGTLGFLQWSASEKKLLYLAEEKQPKTSSFFQKKKKGEKKKYREKTEVGCEHDFMQDWGEQLTKKHVSVMCIIDVESGKVEALEGIPEHISPGQAIWGPDDKSVVFVGWNHEPYRLGLIYCPIRKSEIYRLDIESNSLEQISEDNRACRSPRLSPDQSKLIYLDNEVGGPHMQGSRLMMYNWKDEKLSTIVDIVKDPQGGFPGLYIGGLLSDRCWSEDNKRVVLSSVWRSTLVALVVDTETKKVTPIRSESGGGIHILDVYKDKILTWVSAVNLMPHLCLATLPEAGKDQSMKFVPLDDTVKIPEISFETLQFKPTDRPHKDFGALDYEAVLLMPKTSVTPKPPLIVFPHGGPHSVLTTDFLLFSACYCQCGFAVLQINYRGSFGFGDNNLRSLPGNVGTQDVQDCQSAAESVYNSGKVDNKNVYVVGGSHGGFLTTHLIGQYPKFYTAACCRNPVTNIASMMGTTDIPDWCFTESGYKFDHKALTTEDILAAMWKRSPMQYVDKVQTPLLICLGLDDARVPPKQGMEYHKQLQARNVETRLIAYEENNHPISKVDAQADSCINMIQWFWKFMTR